MWERALGQEGQEDGPGAPGLSWDQLITTLPADTPLPTKSPPLGPGLAGFRAERLQAGGQQSSSFRVVTGLRKGAQGADAVGRGRAGVGRGGGSVGGWGQDGPQTGVPCEVYRLCHTWSPPWRPCLGVVWSGRGSTAEQWHSPGFGVRTGFEFQLLLQESHPCPPTHFPSCPNSACSVFCRLESPGSCPGASVLPGAPSPHLHMGAVPGPGSLLCGDSSRYSSR